MRETQILAALGQGENTIAGMVARLYADLNPALKPAAALTVRAHLEHLMEEGKVLRDGERYDRVV
jgi:hydroxyacylglutathione hydrolase